MLQVKIINDLDEAGRLWKKYWPALSLFDHWGLRMCFQKQYGREPHFVAAYDGSSFAGMIALSRIEETGEFGHFPGETWNGLTWLEENRILAKSNEALDALMERVPPGSVLRYMNPAQADFFPKGMIPDETGYLFFPRDWNYSFQNYMNGFSGKTRKKLRREAEVLTKDGLSFRFDCFEDMEDLFRMNLEAMGEHSYFADPRFLNSFVSLAEWLKRRGMLRVVTMLIGGKTAAVDMGGVCNGNCHVLAGGASRNFPGAAKIINFHHLEWACENRIEKVDFLCGDFNWKARFHLAPRPLYKLSKGLPQPAWNSMVYERRPEIAA